jgi:alpha-galactosidase
MKKTLLSIVLFITVSLVSIGQFSSAPVKPTQPADVLINVGTLHTDLIFKVSGKDGRVYQSYLGPKLENSTGLIQLRDAGHLAYATFGTDNLFEPAIRMTHNDGNPSLELKYVSHKTEKNDNNISVTSILLKDPEYAVEVTLNFKSFQAEDVIEQWVEIVQKESKQLQFIIMPHRCSTLMPINTG